MSLVAASASAEPPAPAPPGAAPPAPGQPGLGVVPIMPGLVPGVPGADQPAGPLEKPSLLKELPIASYIITPIVAGGGAALSVFGTNAANDLKDPSKHTTPGETHSLVVQARVGQVVSYVLFPITGLTTLWGTVGTIRAVMKISKLAKPPPVTAFAAPLPGGVALGAGGTF